VQLELDRVLKYPCTVMLAEDTHMPTAAWRGAHTRLLGATGKLDPKQHSPLIENLITSDDLQKYDSRIMEMLI
jgi:hypothetical protein